MEPDSTTSKSNDTIDGVTPTHMFFFYVLCKNADRCQHSLSDSVDTKGCVHCVRHAPMDGTSLFTDTGPRSVYVYVCATTVPLRA